MAIENFARDNQSVARTKTRQAGATRVKETRACAGSGLRWTSPGCAKHCE
jgi:hypothetical protein